MIIEELVIPNSDLSEEDKKKYLDRIVSNSSDAVSWEYDISTRTMTLDYYDANNCLKDRIVFKNYLKNITDLSLIFPEDEALFECFCKELEENKETVSLDYRSIGASFDITWFRNMGGLVRDDEGKPVKYHGRRYNVTREMTDKDNKSLSQDILTGLRSLDNGSKAIKEMLEKDSEVEVALILIDVDKFHEINEAFGKMQGDALLQTISGLIFTNYMSKDIVCRVAGDQFLVFCSNINKSKAVELTEALRRRVKDNVATVNGHPLTLSAGIACGPESGKNYFDLYTKADIALAYAKGRGGDQVTVTNPKTMVDICMGYTMMKKGRFAEDEKRINKSAKKVNKKLFDFAFETLTKDIDIKDAIEKIFSEVCLFYGLDRAVLQELDPSRQIININARWCRIDDTKDFQRGLIDKTIWYQFEDALKKSEDKYLVLHNGRSEYIDVFREIIAFDNAPVGLAVFPIYDEDNLDSLVFFDSFEDHDFSNNEIATLQSIVRLVRSYLLSRQAKNELEVESVINRNVMDLQQMVYFIVSGGSHKVKFLSPYARSLFPHAEYGTNSLDVLWGINVADDIEAMATGRSEQKLLQLYDEASDSWYNLAASRMKDADSPDDILVCVTNVTDFLTKVRSTDNLTEAETFDSFVVEATKRAINTDSAYGLLYLGIRDFAKINDKYGYVAGDEILQYFATMIKGKLYPDEMVSRIKGDDFVCLIRQHPEDVLSHRIYRTSVIMNDEFRAKYPGIDIECFAGYYSINSEDEYINKCVDRAMIARNTVMKKGIKETFCVYTDELTSEEEKEAEAVKIIKDALNEDRVTVYFQPKVDSVTEEVIGAEALVRIKKEDGGLVSPGIFIPVAEKTGLITDLDDRVYEKTFEYMAKWQAEGKEVPRTSVNVSRLQILDSHLPEKMKAMTDKYGIKPEQVELEITESVFFEDTNRLVDMINTFKEMGYVISMDDFGSGYSTLNFLKTLPVDVIKIDGGFFMKNEMDKKSRAIISAIIQMTENLEFKTVSEGVETKEQVDFIREQGGKCIQGYYFYKPMPADEFKELI